MIYDMTFKIGDRVIGKHEPTYFIADIGANHDGSLERAKMLIGLAKDAGADCAKFQHFRADKIVSKEGFADLKTAHQAMWDKPVYEVYEDYSINREWTVELAETAKIWDIDFMTTPYDLAAIHDVEPYVPAFKIGSGDITYHELIAEVARMGKPIFMATGASNIQEVIDAVSVALAHNHQLCVMQCNTNYTGDSDNIRHMNLNVLKEYAKLWPGLPLGLSDHTPSDTSVLGAVALGARVIEKHFTDDNTRSGPDHAFAVTAKHWRTMRMLVRQMEAAMGDGIKRVEDNERESAIVQRRALRFKKNRMIGWKIEADDFEALRPCPEGAFSPADIHRIIGSHLRRDVKKGDALTKYDID